MNALLSVIQLIVNMYMYAVIAYVVLTWLVSFGLVNMQTPAIMQCVQVLKQIIEPALRPIRQFLSKISLGNLGGIDISPVVLLLALYFLQNLIALDIRPAIEN